MRYFNTVFLDDANVIATHGFIKKSDKINSNEIKRALKLRKDYYNNK